MNIANMKNVKILSFTIIAGMIALFELRFTNERLGRAG